MEFGSRLLNALLQIGVPNRVASLNQAAILNHLGRHAFSRMGKLKLSQYLADLEEKYGMVLYVVDTNVTSAWTQTCISQADCILLVGLAEGPPDIGEYERFLLGMKTTARKELVLLHSDRYLAPGLTRKWLRVSLSCRFRASTDCFRTVSGLMEGIIISKWSSAPALDQYIPKSGALDQH